MTGKPYSIREMKTIVEYLTENKLYSEIKGRKMWMDFANSQFTTRTWQSLKETFIKRILPDVHNPYYKLNMEQINSFRSGYDVAERNKNKLDIQMSDESNANGHKMKSPPSNNTNFIKEENIAGENTKCSKIPSRNRSSADTVIVETCYDTAEDIQRELEEPNNRNSATKSLRDCITYSEPLTPMLQEVLDDFQSEPENDGSDRENVLEIVDSEPVSESIENIQQEIINTGKEKVNGDDTSKISPKSTDEKINKDIKDKNINHQTEEPVPEPTKDSETTCLDDVTEQNAKLDDSKKATDAEDVSKTTENNTEPTQNAAEVTDVIEVIDSSENTENLPNSNNSRHSNKTQDSSLPNNPEALKKRASNEEAAPEAQIVDKDETKATRKRVNSENNSNVENKKTRLGRKKIKAISETEGEKQRDKVEKRKFGSVEPKDMQIKSRGTKDKELKSRDEIENLADILEKPSTSLNNDLDKVLMTSDSDHSTHANDTSEVKNLCLENVSLFDEQLKPTKYETSSDVDANNVSEKIVDKSEVQNEVVILKSHTESEVEELPIPKKHHTRGVLHNKNRERALANVFGFASGTSNSKRKKYLSRKRRISENVSYNDRSSSSEWTSETDGEVYVSPPRGRRNRNTKKYLKPQAGKLLMLEEKGGMFVMSGKKIYPVVKDGKLIKNYVTYMPESESEEENYWKLKYVEEKKKADEFKKLLEQAKRHSKKYSSMEQAEGSRRLTCCHNQHQEDSTNTDKKMCVTRNEEKVVSNVNENIKIKLTTNNDQEIQLEGNWPQINNVLEHVVHIFRKEPQPVSEYKRKTIVEPPTSSGISTPVVITAVNEPSVDPEVHEKVNKIEHEIFKEIEERDKEEEPVVQDSNVTKRRAPRLRKPSQTTEVQSPAKCQKVSDQEEIKTEEPKTNVTKETKITKETKTNTETTDKDDGIVTTVTTKRRSARTSRNNENATQSTSEVKPSRGRPSKAKQDLIINDDENEDEIRYMLPPQKQSIKSTTDKNTRDKSNRSNTHAPVIFSSPETACPNSMESTYGYQDSDPSPVRLEGRRKKLMNFSELKTKGKSHLRRNILRRSCDDMSSFVSVNNKKLKQDNSTLNSDVYRSESYQLLMPKMKTSFNELEQIDENPVDAGFPENFDTNLQPVSIDSYKSSEIQIEFGSSSNVSLPLSPELSVVESLSISKELINDLEMGPTLNEIQFNDATMPTVCNQYLMSNIDVSVPLMQQECGLEFTNSCNNNEAKSLVTESLINKIGAFNIDDQTNVTETLDVKLRDLLLESAKKNNSRNTMNMEVDDDIQVEKKAKNKKRCSTPRKRKATVKSKKAPQVQTVVEEHVESFSQGGRKSCPPIIENFMKELNIENLTIDEKIQPKGRKKKDIIKVKILRPKHNKTSINSTKIHDSKTSVCTDSGINDTVSGVFLTLDESVDLIHNHSETCLHANECVGDSVEFVDNSFKSIVSVEDSMQSADDTWPSQYDINNAMNTPPDVYCNNAQHMRSLYKSKVDDIASTGETEYHSPLGTEMSSLITEDLSDELSQLQALNNKWFLLSEDEATNTNMAIDSNTANVSGVGANLKQIFPITCAVPDLSTISEMSRENDDNSRKTTLEDINGFN